MNADPQPEVVEESPNPVADPAVDVPVVVEEPAVEAAPAAPWFAGVEKLVESSFTGDVDATQYGEMLAKMTPADIDNMPPAAKAIMRGFIEHERAKGVTAQGAITAKEKAASDLLAKAQAEGARITREGAQLNALLTSPEIRRMRDAKMPEKPDLATDAGRRAYFDALAGKHFNETFGPVLQRAETLSGQAAFLDLQDRMPELKDTRKLPELGGRTFLTEVETRLEAREKAGNPTDTETVALILAGELARSRESARIANDRASRAAAAANIQRGGVGGGRSTPKEIPSDVIANRTVGDWLRANPDYVPH